MDIDMHRHRRKEQEQGPAACRGAGHLTNSAPVSADRTVTSLPGVALPRQMSAADLCPSEPDAGERPAVSPRVPLKGQP